MWEAINLRWRGLPRMRIDGPVPVTDVGTTVYIDPNGRTIAVSYLEDSDVSTNQVSKIVYLEHLVMLCSGATNLLDVQTAPIEIRFQDPEDSVREFYQALGNHFSNTDVVRVRAGYIRKVKGSTVHNGPAWVNEAYDSTEDLVLRRGNFLEGDDLYSKTYLRVRRWTSGITDRRVFFAYRGKNLADPPDSGEYHTWSSTQDFGTWKGSVGFDSQTYGRRRLISYAWEHPQQTVQHWVGVANANGPLPNPGNP